MKYFLGIYLLLTGLAQAQTNFENVTIKNVIVNVTTGIHFRINESMTNNEGCEKNSWFKVEKGSPYEKEAFAFLLAMEAQEKPFTFTVIDCTDSYPKVVWVY